MSLPTFGKVRLSGLIAVLAFGFTALFAVLGLGVAVPATFVTGYFLLIPLVWLLGDDFPLVASESNGDVSESTTAEQPVAELRDRYATGEIDEAEFERRLDRLLETEPLDERVDGRSRTRSADRSVSRSGERRERELE
ncbi:putative membrane protein [Halorubrum alkaliphilum]|uniref:Putative membrane protein n=1 Tax=Halorubrum alkaliphilum TaxID=261290 RepID=A0A8T4GF50_9EURY|nr:SHOCT domain-containing protein [Halorubrum alkaliphilum]MBP1922786.1 putative membrane protein [Halorubrum alkaliphilum]